MPGRGRHANRHRGPRRGLLSPPRGRGERRHRPGESADWAPAASAAGSGARGTLILSKGAGRLGIPAFCTATPFRQAPSCTHDPSMPAFKRAFLDCRGAGVAARKGPHPSGPGRVLGTSGRFSVEGPFGRYFYLPNLLDTPKHRLKCLHLRNVRASKACVFLPKLRRTRLPPTRHEPPHL